MNLPTTTLSDMSLTDLERLIQTGEGKYLEFKRTIPSAKKIAREMAAFANSNGGTLLVGVDDDHRILGVDGYHEEEYLLTKAAQQLCSPTIDITIEVLPFDERDILIIYVKESEQKPIYLIHNERRVVYIRQRDKSVTASNEHAEILKNRYSERGVSFEYGPREQRLFQYLNEYERITVNEYSNLINVTSYRASKILINLVSAGILELLTRKNKDYYLFSNECN